MKCIIAGSREGVSSGDVAEAMAACGFANEVTEVVSGTCRGVDLMGESWAKERRLPIKRFPPDWKQYGTKAGPIRNREMAEYADALVAVRIKVGKSDGTDNMIFEAEQRGLRRFTHLVSSPDGAIGNKRAARLESYMKTEVGLPVPLRFVQNFMRWKVESLAELTEDQGRELIRVGRAEMFKVRQQKVSKGQR